MSKKILFFGNERLATGVTTSAPTFCALHDAGYEIACLVIAQNKQAASRNKRGLEIIEVARERGVPIITANKLHEMAEQLAAYGAEAAILVAFGKIVPDNIIKLFPKGILNIHPSLLPKHRGPTPIESVILQGEALTGTSIMSLSADMDAGPVFTQKHRDISDTISKQELADTLLNIGKEMMIELLPGILNGSITSAPQNSERATYDKLITKNDGRLDWQKPADRLAKEVRAYLNWPRSRMLLGNQDLIVTSAHALNTVDERQAAGFSQELPDKTPGSLLSTKNCPLAVQTVSGIFAVDTLIPTGKKEMTAKAFAAGRSIL